MTHYPFPTHFVWGAATAAYQIEGGVQADGRGESIWDRFSHTPGMVAQGHSGDLACDHYHRYPQDIAIMKQLGLPAYRFSIAWSRIFPEGRGRLNQKGLDFYNRLVDALLQEGITPLITLYHWDLPQGLQENGGWDNRDTIDCFADYAACVFEALGDRVKQWITHNEPWVAAFAGHFQGRHAPGLSDLSLAVRVSHHLLLSHARAVQVFRNCRHHDGRIGITLNLYPMQPASDSAADQQAARLADGHHNRWFLDPALTGKYPQDLLELYTKTLGAPVIHPGDLELLAASPLDFLGVNYYFRKIITHSGVHPVLGFEAVQPEKAPFTAMNWEIYPQGLYDLLLRLNRDYHNPAIWITENGAAFADQRRREGIIADDDRLEFLKGHFAAAWRAIHDGVNLEAYYVWSLLDNFEWAHGYQKRFGLIGIDYQTQERIWKKSALWYKEVIANNGFKDDFNAI